MKEIQLTQGKVALVDDEDFEYLNQWKWHANENYAVRTRRSTDKRGPSAIRMHRLIINAPDGLPVDHKNGDTLDNRKSNLRLCTHAQNQHNRTKYSSNTSAYKGVCWLIKGQCWEARIKYQGKYIHLGRYKDKHIAAITYNEAALKYHGEFARLNIIEEGAC